MDPRLSNIILGDDYTLRAQTSLQQLPETAGKCQERLGVVLQILSHITWPEPRNTAALSVIQRVSARAFEKMDAVVEAIKDLHHIEKIAKNEIIASLAENVAVSFTYSDCYMTKFTTQDNTVDVALTQTIVRRLYTKREDCLLKALHIAETYLKANDLDDTFHQAAHRAVDYSALNRPLLEKIVQFPLKEKGRWIVAIIDEMAKQNVQAARNLIESVKASLSEEDLIEAYICIATARIAKRESLEHVLDWLTYTISPERCIEAKARLAEKLLDSKQYWPAGITLVNTISLSTPKDLLDPLYAKAAIAEAETALESLSMH